MPDVLLDEPGSSTPADADAQDHRTPVPSGVASAGSGSLGAVMFVVGAAAAFVAARPLSDNSFLTHLATGRLILDRGVPSENPFLFTGTEFPVPSWWWSIVLALTDELAGGTGLRVLTALVAGLLGALLVRLARPGQIAQLGDGAAPGLLATVLPAVLALVCVLPFLSGRPHLAGFVLLALALLIWNEHRSPWWLVPLFAVWVNVHGSWLYGIAVLGLMVVVRAVDERRIVWRDLWVVPAAVAGSVLGGALYPDAFEILLLPTRQFGDPVEREALGAYAEWSRVGWDQPVLWALLVMGAVALVGALRTRRWGSAGAVVLLVLLGWSGGRLVPIAAVSLVPFAAAAMRGVGSLELPARRAARVTVAAGVVLVVGALAMVATTPAYELDRYPVAAVDWLEARDLVGEQVRLVSHDDVGNYLEWRYGEDANAYVDDRPDAATLLQYRELLRAEDGWQDELASVDADLVLWRADSDLTEELRSDPTWTPAVEVDDYVVFCSAEIAARCS